jgi:hypothetical protein
MRREKMTRKRERVKRPAAASVLPLGVCWRKSALFFELIITFFSLKSCRMYAYSRGRLQRKNKKKTPWPVVRKQTIPTERKFVSNIADRWCRVVSAKIAHGR